MEHPLEMVATPCAECGVIFPAKAAWSHPLCDDHFYGAMVVCSAEGCGETFRVGKYEGANPLCPPCRRKKFPPRQKRRGVKEVAAGEDWP